MIIKKILIFCFFLLPIKLFSQEVNIPTGVHYKVASDSINNVAKKNITQALKREDKYSLFDKLVYIGPQLWERYEKITALNNIQGGDIQINIPQYDKQGNVIGQKKAPAKLIQNLHDFKLIWNQLIHDISEDPINIRKLTSKELVYYWSVIFYDIEEPVFVIENKKVRILLQLSSDKFRLFWIDEFLF